MATPIEETCPLSMKIENFVHSVRISKSPDNLKMKRAKIWSQIIGIGTGAAAEEVFLFGVQGTQLKIGILIMLIGGLCEHWTWSESR